LQVISGIGQFQDAAGRFDRVKYLARMKAMGISPGEYEDDFRRQLLEDKLQRYVAASVGFTEAEAKSVYDFRAAKIRAECLLFPLSDYMAKAAPSDAEITKHYEENIARFAQPERISLDYIVVTPKTLAGAYPPAREEIAAYFEKNKDKFGEPVRYDVRHILLSSPPDGSTEEGAAEMIAQASKRADDVLAQLRKGADFSDIARQYSEDPRSAPDGGALGWIPEGVLPASLEKAVSALKPGEISDIARSPFGFHIFKLDGKTDAAPARLEKAEARIIEELSEEKAAADFERVQTRAEEALLGKSLADIARDFKLRVESSGVIALDMVPQLLAIQPNALEILKNVPVGKVAPSPLEAKEGIVLAQVKDRLAAAPQPLDEVRASIAGLLTAQTARGLAREAAEKALPDIASGKTQPDKAKLKMSEPFGRMFSVVPPLGEAPELAQALGGAPVNVWLPAAYDTPEGGVLARATSVAPPTEEEWAAQKQSFMEQYLQAERNKVVSAFMQNLFVTARITVRNDMLQKIAVR
jgi:peptidyl-prolyl cis-trans isomerase D